MYTATAHLWALRKAQPWEGDGESWKSDTASCRGGMETGVYNTELSRWLPITFSFSSGLQHRHSWWSSPFDRQKNETSRLGIFQDKDKSTLYETSNKMSIIQEKRMEVEHTSKGDPSAWDLSKSLKAGAKLSSPGPFLCHLSAFLSNQNHFGKKKKKQKIAVNFLFILLKTK